MLLKNIGRLGTFLALSVQPTMVIFNYNLGQGGGNSILVVRSVGNTRFNNDQWHRIGLSFTLNRVGLRVDDFPEVTNTSQSAHQIARLDIDSSLFVGSDPEK